MRPDGGPFESAARCWDNAFCKPEAQCEAYLGTGMLPFRFEIHPAYCFRSFQLRNLLFVSGQVGENADEKLVEGGAGAQMEQAIINLKCILEAAGSSLDKVLMIRLFISYMEDVGEVNRVYDEYFGGMEIGPARYALIASAIAEGYLVELAAFAAV